jgi:hypothetical protein
MAGWMMMMEMELELELEREMELEMRGTEEPDQSHDLSGSGNRLKW